MSRAPKGKHSRIARTAKLLARMARLDGWDQIPEAILRERFVEALVNGVVDSIKESGRLNLDDIDEARLPARPWQPETVDPMAYEDLL